MHEAARRGLVVGACLVGRSFRNANQSLLVGGRINLSSKLAIRTNRTL